MVMLLSTKLDLLWKVFDKFKELTTWDLLTLVMLKSFWIMLAIAAFYDYEIWQMDVETESLMDFLKKSRIWCN